jgi:hypothetical protein
MTADIIDEGPLGLRNADLADLAALLKEQQFYKVDVVAPAAAIRARDGRLEIDGSVPLIGPDGVTTTAGSYLPTGVCDQGIADKRGIPVAYLRRLREQRPCLYDVNVNGWLAGDPRKFLVRCLRDVTGAGAARVPTADLAAVQEIATRLGAKILLTGDTAQLSAPQAGGAMQLLAEEHGYYQLSTVQRFEQAWESDASVRLRAGDVSCLPEYARRGRVLSGTRDQMAGTACRRWLADYLLGTDSLLLATTNAQAADLARRARDELAGLGLVAGDGLAELADGNEAGAGDLIIARQNTRTLAGEPGRRLANCDVLRIDGWAWRGGARFAVVRRRIAPGQRGAEPRWSGAFELPESYLADHADLGYAGNVHAAEGRTVDTGHMVIDDTADRESVYVGMTGGRARNTVYVITAPARAADLAPGSRPAPAITDPDAGRGGYHDPLAVLAGALEREQAERTATATLRQELEDATSLATVAPMWADLTRAHATRRYEGVLRDLLPPGEWQRCQADPERGTLTRLLRAAELAGHDARDVLRHAVASRERMPSDSR